MSFGPQATCHPDTRGLRGARFPRHGHKQRHTGLRSPRGVSRSGHRTLGPQIWPIFEQYSSARARPIQWEQAVAGARQRGLWMDLTAILLLSRLQFRLSSRFFRSTSSFSRVTIGVFRWTGVAGLLLEALLPHRDWGGGPGVPRRPSSFWPENFRFCWPLGWESSRAIVMAFQFGSKLEEWNAIFVRGRANQGPLLTLRGGNIHRRFLRLRASFLWILLFGRK